MFAKNPNYWWENPNSPNQVIKIEKREDYCYDAWGVKEQARIRQVVIKQNRIRK